MHEMNESPGGLGRGSREVRDTDKAISTGGRLTTDHAKYLAGQAVKIELAEALGVRSLLSREDNPAEGVWENFANHPAILFPWRNDAGDVEFQVRPDNPTEDNRGRPRKYLFRKGMTPVLWAVRPIDTDTERVLLVEGTKQCLAAASYAPPGVAVYGMAGCRMWQIEGQPIPDLQAFSGHPVVVVLDADAAGNIEVYNAGMELRAALELEGVRKVTFGHLPGADKSGLDDVLAARTTDAKRAEFMANLIDRATSTKPAREKPKAKKPGQPIPTGVEPLDVSNAADCVDWLRCKLGHAKMAGYFLRDGQLVYCPAEGEEGYTPTARTENEEGERDADGPNQVRVVTPDQITARVGHEFWCYQDSEKAGKTHALFPLVSARTAMADLALFPHVRTMRGVTHTPLVRADGSILDTPGYDPATRLYFLPIDGLKVVPVPDRPSRDDVRAAVALLDETIWDFPFRSDDHRANFLGMLLTPLLRELCPPPYKIAVFDAPQSRSGKTLLSKVARTLHGGVVRASIPADEAEWSKTISTILNVTTAPIVTFDNVRGEVVSGVLDSLLTESRFDARQLGTTGEMIQRANDRFWSLTSNNAKLGGDLVKRALWVSINPDQTNPEARTGFRHPDLVGWVAEHRAELLAALLTLVRAWIVAGRPAASRPGTDIYVRWTETVRAVLEHAGVPGTFDAPESKLQAVSEEEQDWTTFLSAVRRVFGDQPWTCRQLVEAVDRTVGLMDAVETIHPDELPGNLGERITDGRDVTRSLGRFLGFKSEAWQNGYMVKQAGTTGRNKTVLWVVKVEGHQTGGSRHGQTPQDGGTGSGQTPQDGGSPHGGTSRAGFRGFAGSPTTHPVRENNLSGCEGVITGKESVYGDMEWVGGDPANPSNPALKVPRRPEALDFACESCGAGVGSPCPGVPDRPSGELDGLCDSRADTLVLARNVYAGYVQGDEVHPLLVF